MRWAHHFCLLRQFWKRYLFHCIFILEPWTSGENNVLHIKTQTNSWKIIILALWAINCCWSLLAWSHSQVVQLAYWFIHLKEKFIPKWQDFFFLPTKGLHKGRLLTKILTPKELSNPMKFLSKLSSQKFESWKPPSSFRSCTRSHGHKKTQSKTKKKEILSDLICLPNSGCLFTDPLFSLQSPSRVCDKKKGIYWTPAQEGGGGEEEKKNKATSVYRINSGWVHHCQVRVTRLLGVLQDGGPKISNFRLL